MAERLPFAAPKLGVGMVFSAALRSFLQRRPEALDVLEIEPQTLWLADDAFSGPFFEFTPAIDAFTHLPNRKLIHSVGLPLGGTRPPDPAQMTLLAATAERLKSPWVSEHLAIGGTPHRASGFFLPPLQTDAGVETAVQNIRAFSAGIGKPVAVETGVAYFKRKPFEMPDGSYLANVVNQADCGILLDLHNLYCNERNGRYPLDSFLAEIPLDRVWEIHLAGGVEMDGYWLDSHSGPMPNDLAQRALEIVKSLPNLGAINFEIYDTFLEKIDNPTLDRVVEKLRRIWDEAGHSVGDAVLPPTVRSSPTEPVELLPDDWENTLTEAVWKSNPALHPWQEDAAPLKLYSKLARSFRGSMLTRALPRSIRYLLLRDREAVETLLGRYFEDEDPKLYTPLEAVAFQQWLTAGGEDDPLLLALLDYDMAFMKIVRQGKPQVVTFPGDPSPVFEALADARLPSIPEPPIWEIEILPDSYMLEDFTSNATSS